jgi:hypothetical protein
MADITLIQNEYATLVYHPDSKIVHHTFLKPISGQYFRDVLNMGIETLNKYNATKWLSDDRNNSAMPPEDSEWSLTDWYPRAAQSGWKYWAMVVPNDILGRMDVKRYIEANFERGIRVMVFTNPEEAMTWLLNIDAAK